VAREQVPCIIDPVSASHPNAEELPLMLFLRRPFRCWLAVGLPALLTAGCGSFGDAPLLVGDPEVSAENVIEEHECVDLWSIVHFGSGYLLGDRLGENSLFNTLAILTVYEIIEPEFWPGFGENQINQECDIVAGALGWLGWYLTEGD
jgi:hypothetical protein